MVLQNISELLIFMDLHSMHTVKNITQRNTGRFWCAQDNIWFNQSLHIIPHIENHVANAVNLSTDKLELILLVIYCALKYGRPRNF